MRDLTELNKLEEYLKEKGIEYTREDQDNTLPPEVWRVIRDYTEPMDLHQIIVYENGRRSWDVVCHRGSYGDDQGLLEGMGDIFGSDVEGYLTAEDVIKKIEEGD